MAARTPRRSFATPFVITLAAAPAACYVQSSPGPTSQTPTSEPPTTQSAPPTTPPPDTRPNPVVMNPPRPQPVDQTTPAPPPPTTTTANDIRWTLMKIGNDCQASVHADCPKGAMCNPPPPFKYACPADMTADQSLALVSHDNGATCTLEYPMPNCPPKAVCNPPRPRPAACPKR